VKPLGRTHVTQYSTRGDVSKISQSDYFPKVLVLISFKYDFAYDLPLYVINNNEKNCFFIEIFPGIMCTHSVHFLRWQFARAVSGCTRLLDDWTTEYTE
jgi:hypothetical protein